MVAKLGVGVPCAVARAMLARRRGCRQGMLAYWRSIASANALAVLAGPRVFSPGHAAMLIADRVSERPRFVGEATISEMFAAICSYRNLFVDPR